MKTDSYRINQAHHLTTGHAVDQSRLFQARAVGVQRSTLNTRPTGPTA